MFRYQFYFSPGPTLQPPTLSLHSDPRSAFLPVSLIRPPRYPLPQSSPPRPQYPLPQSSLDLSPRVPNPASALPKFPNFPFAFDTCLASKSQERKQEKGVPFGVNEGRLFVLGFGGVRFCARFLGQRRRFLVAGRDEQPRRWVELRRIRRRGHAQEDLAEEEASVPSSISANPNTSAVSPPDDLKVLTHVLSADSIRFSIYPVASAAAAAALLASFSASQPLCLLLINWGAHRDLRAILPPAATAFVVDSHRPVHLHNLATANDRVVVLITTDDEHTADLSYEFDVSSLADASDLTAVGDAHDHLRVAEEDEDSDASDSDSDDEGGRRKRRRLSDDAEEDGDPVRLFGKLRREYYRLGTFHGKPSGCLMYELAHAMRKNTNELLWLACVSLTDQFVHEHITNERYQAAVMELEQHFNGSGNLDPSGVGSVVTLKDGTKIRWLVGS